MAILKSTQVNGDLSVNGSLNVQGNLTYVGVENLLVKDKQIELNTDAEGTAASADANDAGIVIRGARKTTQNVDDDASILYDSSDDTLVVNKTIKGTVSNATTAASANKVANILTVNVTDKTGTVKTVFNGSEAKTVNVNLKKLQDQIDNLTGGAAGSVATQITNAINDLNGNVTATAAGTPTKDGVFVLQGVTIDEKAGKLTSATPTAVEVEKAGAAAAVKIELIGKGTSDKNSDTIEGAKKYADSLADNYAKASHTHEIDNVNGLQAALNGKAAASHTHVVAEITDLDTELAKKQDNLSPDQLNAVNSGITAEKVTGYDKHVANDGIHVTPTDKANWDVAEANAKKYTDDEIKNLGLGTAAKKNVLTVAIADSSSDDLVTAAQVKAYAAGVVGAMHFRGAVKSLDEITDPASGDICLVGTKEYVHNGSDWVLFGDESAYDTAGSAAAVLGKEGDDSTVTTVYGVKAYAKKYADSLAKNYAAASHKHAIADVEGLQDALDEKQVKLTDTQLAAVDSGITATKVSGYDTHVGNNDIHVIAADKTKWNNHVSNGDIHVTAEQKTAWDAKQNALANADVLAAITSSTQVTNWENAAAKAHEHANKSILDGITADKVAAWDGAKKYTDEKVSALSGSVATTDAAQDAKINSIKGDITSIQSDINNITNGTTLNGKYVNVDGDTMTGELTMSGTNIRMPENGINGIIFGNMKIVWKDNAIEFIPTTA